jgi:uncharacterized protein
MALSLALGQSRPWLPYVGPFAAYALLSFFEGSLSPEWHPAAYAAKVLLVSALAFFCRTAWADLRPGGRDLLPAAVVGLAAFVFWIGVDVWPGYPHLGSRRAFNPLDAISEPAGRGLFLTARLYGLVVLVPLIEELFWRSFLLRYASCPEEFPSVAPYRFTLSAAALCTFAFAAAHPEWLAASITAALYTALLAWRKSVFACVVAHAVTNLCLGLYVLHSGAWAYW